MSKNKAQTSKTKIEEVRCEELLASAEGDLENWISSLKRQIKFMASQIDSNLLPLSRHDIILAYLKFLAQFMSIDRFDANSPYNQNLEFTVKTENTVKALLLGSNLLNINKENPLTILASLNSLPSIRKLQPQNLEKIMVSLLIYSKGFIPLNNELKISLTEVGRSTFGELRYFSNYIENNISVLYSVGYEQIPLFSPKTKEIDCFQLKFCVQIEQIFMFEENRETESKIKEAIGRLEGSKDHQSRYLYNFKEWNVDEMKRNRNLEYFSWKKTIVDNDKAIKVQAYPFQRKKCTKFESLSYFFERDQQLFYKIFVSTIQQQSKNQQIQTSCIEQSEINFSRAGEYVDFITQIPNFKFKLTKQQKEVLGKNGTLIVIGRSGTGKTLLSILRLYAIEFISKSSIVYRGMRQGKLNKDCIQHYINQCFQEKNVFLTASPYLIEEIMKQYKDMHYQLQKQHKKNCQECQELLHIDFEIDGGNIDLEELLERIERRENIFCSVSALKKVDFPEFFTVKSIVNIIDCGLQRPFFNLQGTIKNKEKERKIINIYSWENTSGMDEPYGKHMLENQLNYYSRNINQMKCKNTTLQAIQIDYQIFSQSIWKEISSNYFKSIKNERPKLNAAVVWAQIFSIIKGSVKAHTTHLKCLSPLMYLQQSKSLFLNQQEKMDIYYLFQHYQAYKIYNKCYDMMDVVNHILQELMLNRYADEYLDYMFIDEVQDLTPATIFLLTKMTKKNVFYCGDTAQAISKGVAFKFSEIKSLFSKKYFKHCIDQRIVEKEQHLTVNFRSHNRILKLANMIIEMIKELFPKSIDIMKTERSDLFGPKPILIDNGDERLFFDLLLSPQLSLQDRKAEWPEFNESLQRQEYDKIAELMNRKLSSEQVILVRNNQEKMKMPCYLKKQIQLTCQEVKGLEYQDVVIYKFFESSPCKQKWGLLDSLSVACRYVEAKQFQRDLSRRSLEQGLDETAPQLEMETMISLGYDTQKKMYKIFDLFKNSNYAKLDIKEFIEISNELKMFYTLVTRAKNTVIIFDRNIPRQLMKLFNEFDIVSLVYREELAEKQNEIIDYKLREGQERYLNKANLWNQEAIKHLVRENYDEAMKCFERAENKTGFKRVLGMRIEKATNYELFRIEAQFQNPAKLPRQEFELKKIKLKKHQKSIYERLRGAGELYEDISLFQKAGEIYLKTEQYQSAIRCLKQTSHIELLAEAYFKKEQYENALNLFQKCQDTSRIIDCYIKLQNWKKVLSFMIQNKDELKKLIADKNNEKFKQDIKLCLKNSLDQILETSQIKKEQEFNKPFQRDAIIDYEKVCLVGNQKIIQKRLAHINNQYNIFSLKTICQNLDLKNQQYNSRSKQIEGIMAKLKFLSDEESKLKDLITKIEQKIDKNTQILRKWNLSIIEINTPNEMHKILFDQQKNLRKSMTEHKTQLEIIAKQYQDKKRQLEKYYSSQNGEQKMYDHEQLKSDIQILKSFLDGLFKMKNDQKMSQSNITGVDILHQKYSENRNKVFKIWLSDHSIESVLKKTKDILAVAAHFIKLQDPKKHSTFDYRGVRDNIEGIICGKGELLNEALWVFNFLEKLNCQSLRYILCDYFGLQYHVHWLILEDTLRYSRNFYQKRKVKQVLHVPTNKIENQQILNRNEKTMARLGDNVFKAVVSRYATKQCTYIESLFREVIQGLILQGFYKNCLKFCSEKERYNLANLFMDYDILLRENIEKAKNIRRQNMKKEMKYYFFSTDIGLNSSTKQSELKHQNLINIFSIQKIFFDFDKCEESPILSKPREIDEIQLNQYQIQQCEKESEERLADRDVRNFNLRIEIMNLQKQREKTVICYNKQFEQRQQNIEQKKKDLSNLNKEKEIYDELQRLSRKRNKLTDSLNFQSKKKMNDFSEEREKKIKELKDAQTKYKHFKSYGGLMNGQQQFKKKLLIMRDELKRVKQEIEKIEKIESIVDNNEKQQQNQQSRKQIDQKIIQLFQKQNENLEKAGKQEQLRQQINNLLKQKEIYKKLHQNKLSEFDNNIKIKKEEIKRWQKRTSEDKEREINLNIINGKKRAIVNHYNEQNRLSIIQDLKNSSNLSEIKELKFLNCLIQKKFMKKKDEVDFLSKDPQNAKLLLNILNAADQIENGTLKSHQICLIIIVYLSFLFNKEFRNACIQFFLNQAANNSDRFLEFKNLKRKIKLLQSEKQFIGLKIKQLEQQESKMKSRQIKANSYQMRNLNNSRRQLIGEDQKLNNEYNILRQRVQSSCFAHLNLDPMANLHKLLSIYSKIKNVSQKTYNFMEIFMGFFQCRIIKNCDYLSFLEGEYVLIEENSIILKKMVEANLLNFGYYFDCQNRTVLATFDNVYKAILKYLQKQQKKIYEEEPQLNKFQKQNNEILKDQKKTRYIDKKVLGFPQKENKAVDEIIKRTIQLIENDYQGSQEKKKFYQDYQDNKLLTKARVLKQEILEFYLGKELKEKESFFFALHQLKEYQNIEVMVRGMTIFNPKTMKELTEKLGELQKIKKEWINNQRNQCDSLPCKLEQQ